MKKIMISAGEVSGDVHGSYLVNEIKKLAPDAYIFGMGSERLKASGADIKLDISKRGTVGLVEVLPNAIPILFNLRKMVKLMDQEKPDMLILIDSQGFNVPLAREAKKRGIKTVYYIAPQEWLWGTKKGMKKVADCTDQIIAIWQKEADLYRDAGANVDYFGHPLLDIVKTTMDKPAFCKKYNLKENDPIIAVCPGSRTQEIYGLLPIFLEACEIIHKQVPKAQFIIPAASTYIIKQIFKVINGYKATAVIGSTHDIVGHADLAMAASGTINLEACILGTPNIMVYKLHPLTYWIGKNVLKIGEKMNFFSMPNILCNEEIIPELIQDNANPENIAKTAMGFLDSEGYQRHNLGRVKQHLGAPPVISRIAMSILE
ncbi:MAG: lipid-A-disaccharide synthase [Candidatus Margulisbacteria bacterium]|nr:lipid-A-disaccharide synthase [Candidatus Margulisiibacteriota bacterium]